MEEQQFYAKLSKCEFGMTEMLYLGHIIGVNGVRVHEEKIRAIRDWPELRNVTELLGFIGICTYVEEVNPLCGQRRSLLAQIGSSNNQTRYSASS